MSALLLGLSLVAAGAWEDVDFGATDAWVYTPTTAGPRPLVVFLHGCAQRPEQFKEAAALDRAADRHNVVLALARVPDLGVIAGCWNYFGETHRRSEGNPAAILEIVNGLRRDPKYGLDHRAALAGFSSGGGETMVLACLAPDVFQVVGVAAGPTLGTNALESTFVATDRTKAASLCRTLAGPAAPAFATQRAALLGGTEDKVVAPGYAPLNADIFRDVYETRSGNLSEATYGGFPEVPPTATARRWSDATGPRITLFTVPGLDHAYPSGVREGPDKEFIQPGGPAFIEEVIALIPPVATPDAGLDAGTDAGVADAGQAPASSGCQAVGGANVWAALLALSLRRGASRARRDLRAS